MKPFLLLYTMSEGNFYSEGLIHLDGRVYVNGFYPSIDNRLFDTLLDLKHYMRDLRYIITYTMLDGGKQL